MELEKDGVDYQDFLHYLMNALKEEQIQKEIQQMISEKNEQSPEDKERTGELEVKLASIQEAWQKEQLALKEEKAISLQLRNNIANLKQRNESLEKEVTQLQGKNSDLKSRFAEQIKVFEVYQNLSSSLKSSLSGIFRGDGIERFLFCGVQKHNIELLWDAIKIRVIDEKEEELEGLKILFFYFFHAFNSTFEKPLYELQSVQMNEKYDHELHIKTAKSRVSGNIKEVVLPGYLNTNSKKVERKSVVKL